MRRVPASLLLLTFLAATSADAQIQNRPTDPPLVTANNESWYIAGEPIQLAGDVYYPAGAAVFFDGNRMVRSGHYNGVPVYSDTTIEPFSIVYVPVSRGLMQPYERRRQGALAGTTGSRAPSFPVRLTASTTPLPEAAAPPSAPPIPIGAVGAYTPESIAATSGRSAAPSAVGTSGLVAAAPSRRTAIVSLVRPQNNDGLWVRYLGEKWINAGPAVPFAAEGFRHVGSYSGFPVFARVGSSEQVIYLPSREGLVVPYRLKQ